MANISISLRQTKAIFNGTYQKIVEKYIVQTNRLDFDRGQTSIVIINEQLQLIDSKLNENERSDMLSAIFVSFVKKLESNNITYKIANTLTEFYKMAITDWILHDINNSEDYSLLLRDLNLKKNKRYKSGYSNGSKPKSTLNIFPGELYYNRVIGHLYDNVKLDITDLSVLVGCHRNQISTFVTEINEKCPNLIIKTRETDRTLKLQLNKEVLNNVARSQ